MTESFKKLYDFNAAQYVESYSNGMDYISWASTWRLVKTMYPSASWYIHDFVVNGVNYPYLETKYGVFVRVSVEINGFVETDTYALSDKVITADSIANAHQRALCKACGRHGFALKLWESRDVLDKEKLVGGSQVMSNDSISNGSRSPSMKQIDEYWEMMNQRYGNDEDSKAVAHQNICSKYKKDNLDEFTEAEFEVILNAMSEKLKIA
jgi:hypothetical protein